MIQAYQNFLRHSFSLTTVTKRGTYWLVTLINLAILAVFYIGFDLLFALLTAVQWLYFFDLVVAFFMIVWLILATLFVLVTLIPNITMSFRRYRDTGLPTSCFMIEPVLLLSFFWFCSENLNNGYASIWSIFATGLFLLADILVKLLPSAVEKNAK
ncbi:DUF805 domain-containing protein [Fructobacillus sp. M1-13]|uniref:DUF805 domain-containing protein n=1 Tax=Fructobacillus papyriferae TaxID=2713171 RepID=A0ABS5QTR8_9LACO|nr:DUF805 domain-containing protein [Fructobacillus papyriferae]MBS9335322.1 DUF805 domain-containing protein [Fructobacillus papyriferae]MCD2159009.1 DUF805 domain-containing protein [Fructobacillus papyriferae]